MPEDGFADASTLMCMFDFSFPFNKGLLGYLPTKCRQLQLPNCQSAPFRISSLLPLPGTLLLVTCWDETVSKTLLSLRSTYIAERDFLFQSRALKLDNTLLSHFGQERVEFDKKEGPQSACFRLSCL